MKGWHFIAEDLTPLAYTRFVLGGFASLEDMLLVRAAFDAYYERRDTGT